ncbi:hypothetical protein [Chelativorans sp. J32]|uniref:hypothetical protein n=1 Tax=Chelativorans sp. J32 TaxID=935840 RepID=UPI0004B9DC09|nr:hypothetical protein [Chelativorans sp. J32]
MLSQNDLALAAEPFGDLQVSADKFEVDTDERDAPLRRRRHWHGGEITVKMDSASVSKKDYKIAVEEGPAVDDPRD